MGNLRKFGKTVCAMEELYKMDCWAASGFEV